ncbi:MAG: hypothetical protein IJ523_05050 [Succinivibrionaceae bacterium]|nr:hypothetical protein [Succinivibrionaceae bacterium]
MEFDFVDMMVRDAFSDVKAPECPRFVETAQSGETEKKGFWSGVWNRIVKGTEELGSGIRELSDDTLDGVCAAGEKRAQEQDRSREDRDLSGR